MSEYLKNAAIGNTFVRLRYGDDALYHYQRTVDVEKNQDISDHIIQLAQEHFLSDTRFNLPNQKVFNVNVGYHRFNDKEYVYNINYSVGLGLYSNHAYKGSSNTVSQSFKAPEDIVNWFSNLNKD